MKPRETFNANVFGSSRSELLKLAEQELARYDSEAPWQMTVFSVGMNERTGGVAPYGARVTFERLED